MKKVVWGVISTASIGMEKVLPAMQQSAWCDISAIASRSLASARKAADKLGIERAYGSYEELLADPDKLSRYGANAWKYGIRDAAEVMAKRVLALIDQPAD